MAVSFWIGRHLKLKPERGMHFVKVGRSLCLEVMLETFFLSLRKDGSNYIETEGVLPPPY